MAKKVERRQKKAPSWQKKAAEYWARKIPETEIGCDYDEADVRCWRCGHLRTCQKCHIVARSLGGSDDVSNIIPLCAACHDEMPNVSDPSEVWRWIAADHGEMYETYWTVRAIKSCGLSPEQMAGFDAGAVKSLMDQCALHLGQLNGGARISTATLAWAVRKACGL